MTLRLRQWFTDLGPVDPSQPNSDFRFARYNGVYQGQRDIIGQGRVGETYEVRIVDVLKLEAPNPPFQDEETPADEFVDDVKLFQRGTYRNRKWFTIMESNDPTKPTSKHRFARYNGVFNGNRDPINEGEIGRVYPVFLVSETGLEVPNPPFQTSEA